MTPLRCVSRRREALYGPAVRLNWPCPSANSARHLYFLGFENSRLTFLQPVSSQTAGDVQRGEAWQAPGPRPPGVQGRDQVPPGHAEARYVSGTETPRSIVVGRLSRFRVNQSLTRASPLSPQVTSTSSNTLTTTGLVRLLWSSTGASTSAVSSGTSHARSRPLLENRVLPLQCGGAFAGKSRSRSRCAAEN